MGKRKVFLKTDLNIPQVEHSHDANGSVIVLPEMIPPVHTRVNFDGMPRVPEASTSLSGTAWVSIQSRMPVSDRRNAFWPSRTLGSKRAP